MMLKWIFRSDWSGREFIKPTSSLAKGIEPEDLLEQEQER